MSTASSPSRTRAAAPCDAGRAAPACWSASWPASRTIRISAGYVLIGLGCEMNQVDAIRRRTTSLDQLTARRNGAVVHDHPECGGIRKTVEAGVAAVPKLLPRVNDVAAHAAAGQQAHPGHELRRLRRQQRRHRQPGAGRRLATARAPRAAPRILGETPEIYGAEHLLTRRAVSRAVGEKLVERIKWWEWSRASLRRRDQQQPLARATRKAA